MQRRRNAHPAAVRIRVEPRTLPPSDQANQLDRRTMRYVPVSPNEPRTGWVPYPFDGQSGEIGAKNPGPEPPSLILHSSHAYSTRPVEGQLYAYDWVELNPRVGNGGIHTVTSCTPSCPSTRHGIEYISDDRWPDPVRREGRTCLEFRSPARPTAVDAYVWPLTFAEDREYRPPRIDNFYQRLYSSPPGRFHWASFIDVQHHRAPYPALAYMFLRWQVVFDRFAWTREPRDVRDIVRLSRSDLENSSLSSKIHMLPRQQADVEYVLVSAQWNEVASAPTDARATVGDPTSDSSQTDAKPRANVGAVWIFHFASI